MAFLRGFGLIFVLCGCCGIGLLLGRRAAGRLTAVSQAAALLAFLAMRIGAEAPKVQTLFAEAADSGRFEKLSFLPAMKETALPPKQALTEALATEKLLPGEAVRILLQTGAFLGISDRRESCTQLLAMEQELRALLPALQKAAGERLRLCPTLGLLGGIFLDILLL